MGPVDVFAPGYNILSSDICIPNSSCYNPTAIDGDESNTCQRFWTGTSQSTPVVTGTVALLPDKCPNITSTEIKNMLKISYLKAEYNFVKHTNFWVNHQSCSMSMMLLVLR